MLNRRGFMTVLCGAIAAPLIVPRTSLMAMPRAPLLILPDAHPLSWLPIRFWGDRPIPMAELQHGDTLMTKVGDMRRTVRLIEQARASLGLTTTWVAPPEWGGKDVSDPETVVRLLALGGPVPTPSRLFPDLP
jgi:hypothetical protein